MLVPSPRAAVVPVRRDPRGREEEKDRLELQSSPLHKRSQQGRARGAFAGPAEGGLPVDPLPNEFPFGPLCPLFHVLLAPRALPAGSSQGTGGTSSAAPNAGGAGGDGGPLPKNQPLPRLGFEANSPRDTPAGCCWWRWAEKSSAYQQPLLTQPTGSSRAAASAAFLLLQPSRQARATGLLCLCGLGLVR